jgi:hypothetical protein
MPVLGNALDFAKYEGRNFRAHQLGSAPSSPVTGQLYYDTGGNMLYWYNGTAWISASGGTPADATTSSKGVVQLAGDLAGTAAAPVVANGAITSAKIADGTITDVDVAAANKDGVVATPSLRTLGLGAQQAMPGNEPLNLITAPANDVNMNTHKLTAVLDPTGPQDAATKNYVDGIAQGISAKAPVRCASTVAISGGGAPGGAQTIDGIAIANGDRVLLKDQTSAQFNGLWSANTVSSWNRVLDMDAWTEVPSAYVWVETGTVNADTGWVCTADPGGTIGTTAIPWIKFSSAPSQVVGYYSNNATHGAGTTITIPQTTHLLRSARGIHVQVQDNTSGQVEIPDIVVAANGDVTITYGNALTANTKLVTLVG